ncbi:hypothetical protein ACFV9C_38075 [Kribbella sp. NPDC059898]|uniref:hypothetical protein n=1 Tax=Kribbella sp. NPDC059898 TaxID=3346995 RepID=UPI00364CE358
MLLERVTLSAERARLALLRPTYLDEFERRHPLTFAKWLETEPRGSADPAKYFDAHAD